MGGDGSVRLQGAGGSIFEFDLPLSKVIAKQLDKGELRPVDDDAKTAIEVNEEEPTSAGDAPDGPPPKVGAGSGTEAWAAYAQSLGLDVEGMKRADIIAKVEAA